MPRPGPIPALVSHVVGDAALVHGTWFLPGSGTARRVFPAARPMRCRNRSRRSCPGPMTPGGSPAKAIAKAVAHQIRRPVDIPQMRQRQRVQDQIGAAPQHRPGAAIAVQRGELRKQAARDQRRGHRRPAPRHHRMGPRMSQKTAQISPADMRHVGQQQRMAGPAAARGRDARRQAQPLRRTSRRGAAGPKAGKQPGQTRVAQHHYARMARQAAQRPRQMRRQRPPRQRRQQFVAIAETARPARRQHHHRQLHRLPASARTSAKTEAASVRGSRVEGISPTGPRKRAKSASGSSNPRRFSSRLAAVRRLPCAPI